MADGKRGNVPARFAHSRQYIDGSGFNDHGDTVGRSTARQM